MLNKCEVLTILWVQNPCRKETEGLETSPMLFYTLLRDKYSESLRAVFYFKYNSFLSSILIKVRL